jgi:hypothetical protein
MAPSQELSLPCLACLLRLALEQRAVSFLDGNSRMQFVLHWGLPPASMLCSILSRSEDFSMA